MSGRARLALCAAAEVALAGDRWARRTRASRREKRERLPGDDLVSESMWQATHATTIDATADELCHGWSTWGLGDVVQAGGMLNGIRRRA